MSWPNPPYPFANAPAAPAAENTSFLDTMFNQAAAMMEIPCSAAGANAISLTPLANCPALTQYNELGGYRFRAAANSTNLVTAQYNGLGFLNVYHADGATQSNIGDLISGVEYVFRFSQSLNAGLGGFFQEAPAIAPSTSTSWNQPGGRLSLLTSTPVMLANQTGIQNIFYPPYQHPFVPLYNGSVVQMVQFATPLNNQSGLTLALGGAANFTASSNFDVFAYSNSGVPALCAIQWTNNTTRATTLSVFGGFLTNSGSATAQTGPNTSFTLPANQGTFLGTFQTTTQGTTQWVFGGAGSGGVAGSLLLCNYYNKVKFTTQVTDNGASYTYTSATVRQARASTGNQINFVQSDSERAIQINYSQRVSTVAAGGSANIGFGINSTTGFFNYSLIEGGTITTNRQTVVATLSFTGFGDITALENGDGTNANNFNVSTDGTLGASIWL